MTDTEKYFVGNRKRLAPFHVRCIDTRRLAELYFEDY